MVMALARLDVPGLMLYGGSIMYGEYRGRRLTVQDLFEAVGDHPRSCRLTPSCGLTANPVIFVTAHHGASPPCQLPKLDLAGLCSAVLVRSRNGCHFWCHFSRAGGRSQSPPVTEAQER
jgi:hypothetical protein